MAHNPANLIDREAAIDCGGAARASYAVGSGRLEQNGMRAVLALSLLIALSVSANAAKVHQTKSQGAIVRHGEGEVVPRGWYKFPGYPPIPPEQNRNLDPSNFGSG
jgi:hypothetical protein